MRHFWDLDGRTLDVALFERLREGNWSSEVDGFEGFDGWVSERE